MVAALVSGMTFALTQQSEATLTGNTVASGTAALLVDGSDSGVTPTSSEAGFTFSGLIPGGDYSPTSSTTKQLRLKNNGDVPLDVQVQASAITGSLDKTKVRIRFTNISEPLAAPLDYTLAELETAGRNLPGVSGVDSLGTASADEQRDFAVQAKLEAGAITSGSGGSIDAFDLIFTGTNDVEAGS